MDPNRRHLAGSCPRRSEAVAAVWWPRPSHRRVTGLFCSPSRGLSATWRDCSLPLGLLLEHWIRALHAFVPRPTILCCRLCSAQATLLPLTRIDAPPPSTNLLGGASWDGRDGELHYTLLNIFMLLNGPQLIYDC